MKRQLITIVPDLEEENSKTINIRPVPISDVLVPYLKEMELHKYLKHYYLFGSPFAAGKCNRGTSFIVRSKTTVKDSREKNKGVCGTMRSDFLMPSPNHVKRDTVTKLWKRIIMDDPDKGGLGIKKHLYASKHTGGDDKILAGIDLDAVRELYGHRSKFMTENYAKVIKQVNAKQIREKSPSFTPVVPIKKAM